MSDRGAGEPVLLITGWTISSAVFDPVAELYVPHVRVVAYDHRGTGRSARWDGPVSMAMLAADAARVLDEVDLAAAHVVGLSMGAAVAIELAVRMPHRVKSLVVVGGGAGGPTMAMPPIARARRALTGLLTDSAHRRTLWPAVMLFSERFREEHPELVERYVPFFGRHRATPLVAGWQAVAAACYGRRSSLGRIAAPTLVVHGEDDILVVADNARVLEREIPHAELWLVAGAGHAVPLERAEETATTLIRWARRQAGAQVPTESRRDMRVERITRPFSAVAGTARNLRELGHALSRRQHAR